jgi:hypothetical protein
MRVIGAALVRWFRCNAEYNDRNQCNTSPSCSGIFQNSGPKNLNFSSPHLAAPLNSGGRPYLSAMNPADRPHFYGHHRAVDLDPSDYHFRRFDPPDVYHSGVDFDLPNTKPSLTSLRLAQTPAKP